MEIQVILRLLHLWSTKTLVGKAQDEPQVSTQYPKKNCSTAPEYTEQIGSATAIDWYICIQYFIDHPAVIGGPGIEVETDEYKLRKYNRGRAVDGHWVFGGMERGREDSFLVEVAHRDAATLLPIIANHVKPGSIIYSNEWSAYNQLSATTGHVHSTVNHSLYFVDPATGAHTQGVDGMWSARKVSR